MTGGTLSGARLAIRLVCTIALFVGCIRIAVWFSEAAATPLPIDFGSFYHATTQGAAGLSLYDRGPGLFFRANLNPPHWVLLTMPLAWLSPSSAYVIWMLAGAIALWCTARLAATAAWGQTETLLVMTVVVWSMPMFHTVIQGQSSWFLMLIFALAWHAHTRNQIAAAGTWLGLLITVKPFLGLLLVIFAVRREWSGALWACVAGVGAIALGGLVFGPSAVFAWIETLRGVTWTRHIGNASLIGWWQRSPWAWQSVGLWVSIVCVVSLSGWWLWRRTPSVTTGYSVLLLASLLLSPLAWSHYLWLALPLVLTAQPWRTHRWLAVAISVLIIAPALDRGDRVDGWHLWTTSSYLTLALVLAWLATVRALAHPTIRT